jgi:hypothetical protein
MTDRSQDPDLRVAVAAALIELDRNGNSQTADSPGPLEFDERGFPITRPVPRFMRRVERLFGDA